jgi:hypothetical protein
VLAWSACNWMLVGDLTGNFASVMIVAPLGPEVGATEGIVMGIIEKPTIDVPNGELVSVLVGTAASAMHSVARGGLLRGW